MAELEQVYPICPMNLLKTGAARAGWPITSVFLNCRLSFRSTRFCSFAPPLRQYRKGRFPETTFPSTGYGPSGCSWRLRHWECSDALWWKSSPCSHKEYKAASSKYRQSCIPDIGGQRAGNDLRGVNRSGRKGLNCATQHQCNPQPVWSK